MKTSSTLQCIECLHNTKKERERKKEREEEIGRDYFCNPDIKEYVQYK